ncbi:MAG: GAF domain-containing protein, partial [Alphaproteobacteria bacterium]|nr:GAF domain-containing protein [Alphaproteobacteria bacterium]
MSETAVRSGVNALFIETSHCPVFPIPNDRHQSAMLSSKIERAAPVPVDPKGSVAAGRQSAPALARRGGRDSLLVFLDAHSEIIRLIAKTGKLERALGRIAALAEELFEPAGCVIQLVDTTTGTVRNAAVAGLPSGFVHGLAQGNCHDDDSLLGLTILTRRNVEIADLSEDSIPDRLRELPLVYDLRSCWIHPAIDKNGGVVGIFGLFFRVPRRPDSYETRIASALANLVGFSVQQDRRATALRAADERFAALAASIPGVVYQRIVTPQGDVRYTYISEAAKDLFGVPSEEILADPNALFDCHGP